MYMIITSRLAGLISCNKSHTCFLTEMVTITVSIFMLSFTFIFHPQSSKFDFHQPLAFYLRSCTLIFAFLQSIAQNCFYKNGLNMFTYPNPKGWPLPHDCFWWIWYLVSILLMKIIKQLVEEQFESFGISQCSIVKLVSLKVTFSDEDYFICMSAVHIII